MSVGETVQLGKRVRGVKSRSLELAFVAMVANIAFAQPVMADQTDGVSSPVKATFQSQPDLNGLDLVRVGGGLVRSSPIYVNIESSTASLAYTLDPRTPTASGQSWKTNRPDLVGVRGVAAAEWMVSGKVNGPVLADDELEFAARQIAIWVKGGFLSISAVSVPDRALRERAMSITIAAPNSLQTSLKPGVLRLSAFQRRADSQFVDIEVTASQPGIDLEGPQKVNVRLSGEHFILQTGRAYSLEGGHLTDEGKISLKTGKPNIETSTLSIPRPKVVTAVDFKYVVEQSPGLVLVSDGGDGPSLVTGTSFDIEQAGTVMIDPDNLPDPLQVVNSHVAQLLSNVAPPVFWILLVVGLYLIPKFSSAIDWLVKRTVRLIRNRRIRHDQEVL